MTSRGRGAFPARLDRHGARDPGHVSTGQAQARHAAQLGSRALRADAIEAVTCGWLSFVVVIGLVAQLAIGAWWIDSVTSLAILWLLIKEGREALSG